MQSVVFNLLYQHYIEQVSGGNTAVNMICATCEMFPLSVNKGEQWEPGAPAVC